jgi:hypothetical protein
MSYWDTVISHEAKLSFLFRVVLTNASRILHCQRLTNIIRDRLKLRKEPWR